MVVGNAGGGGVNGAVVVVDVAQQVAALGVGEEQPGERFELGGDGVVAVEVGVVEHLVEDVAGEDVLDHHLADVVDGDAGVDLCLAELEELVLRLREGGVVVAAGHNAVAERVDNGGDIGLKLLDGLLELVHRLVLKLEEVGEQPVQLIGLAHGHALHLLAALEEDGGAAIFEEDVGEGVSLVDLGIDLGLYVVLLVLALPVADVEPPKVLGRTVGVHLLALGAHYGDLGDHLVVVLAGVLVEQRPEVVADALLVGALAVLEGSVEVLVVLVYE